MFTPRDYTLKTLAKSLQIGPALSCKNIPRDFLNLDGFRLSESPKKTSKVMFLGMMLPWGDVDLKICPRLQWMMDESDLSVISLGAEISTGIYGAVTRKFIGKKRFESFMEQLSPEKTIFIAPSNLNTPEGLKSLAIIEEFGAKIAFASDMIRLQQGLFMEVGTFGCEIKAKSDLAKITMNSSESKPIYMEKSTLRAQNLGSFSEVVSDTNTPGKIAQIEFALYDQWKLERVRWDRILQSNLGGYRLISC